MQLQFWLLFCFQSMGHFVDYINQKLIPLDKYIDFWWLDNEKLTYLHVTFNQYVLTTEAIKKMAIQIGNRNNFCK